MGKLDAVFADAGHFPVHRFGRPGARPRVYLQAGLHADEVAGTLVLQQLARKLEADQRDGRIQGEIVVVPHCNPVGLRQFVLGRHLGRFDLRDGRNFNRGFPDIAADVIAAMESSGKSPPTRELAVEIGLSVLAGQGPSTDGAQHRIALMELSWGSDIVIDVHSDMEAILHMYTSEASWPGVMALGERLDLRVALLADVSADLPFEEAHSYAWRRIDSYLRDKGAGPTQSVSSCTIELRGLADIDDILTPRDAHAFHAFLIDAGAVLADCPAAPLNNTIQPTRLEAVDMVPSPCNGVLVHCKSPGDRVRNGDLLARIFDPAARDTSRAWTEITATAEGIVFARWHQRVIEKGMSICKIASTYAPEHATGRLLD